jgi:glycosyltransferase involved in cell wall biosynthesis
MASNWVRLGHQVTMISEVPNHPAGIITPAYRRKLYQIDDLDGIETIRVWVKASPRKNFSNRIIFYFSFMVNAILAGLFLARRSYDLIYATSPPLFVGGAALALSSLRHLPLVFEVRDLWPESAVALGELSNPRAISLANRLESACYDRAKKIVVVTQGIQNRLISRGIPSEKICLIPNGANIDLFNFKPEERQHIRRKMGWEGKFVALYAGILGIAQGLETVVETAQLLRDREDIQIVMIGEGPSKKALSEAISEFGLANVSLLSEQPREQIPAFLSASDVALIPLRNAEIFRGALPSKLFDAWACQRPVLLSVDGEARGLMEQARAGLFVSPEDSAQMASAILYLKSQPEIREEMGIRGREITMQYYSRKAQAENLAKILASITL